MEGYRFQLFGLFPLGFAQGVSHKALKAQEAALSENMMSTEEKFYQHPHVSISIWTVQSSYKIAVNFSVHLSDTKRSREVRSGRPSFSTVWSVSFGLCIW